MERVNEPFNLGKGYRESASKSESPLENAELVQKESGNLESPRIELAESSLPKRERTNPVLKAIHKTWDKEPYGYVWPASRLSRHEMARLTIVSNQVKRPLNQLIKEAVDFYATMMLEELGYCTSDESHIANRSEGATE